MTVEPTRPDERPAGETGVPAPVEGEPILELDGVMRSFGEECAIGSLSLSVEKGELLTLLGPSGCGKTTTLRLLAGLDRPDKGVIRIAGEVVTGDGQFVPPENRDVGLVFQEFALFPHLSVAENVAFGIQDWPAEERDERIENLLELVSLPAYADDSPDDLSGGQRQRVALARSLAPEPDVLLLDEPFSNLDVALRKEMREEVREILKAAGVTAVSVTHDQEEALSISDRVAVVHDGEVEQVGRPESVFEHPESRFVADFLGQAGFVSGRLTEGLIETGLGTLHAGMLEGISKEYDGAALDVLVRPDDLGATPVDSRDEHGDKEEKADGATQGNGRVVTREYTGPAFVYGVELDSGELVHCQHNHAAEFELGERVDVDLTADHTLAWFPAE